METKKSEKAQLSSRRGMYMNVGLVIALACVISAFEWKSYGDVDYVTADILATDVEIIEIPITRDEIPKIPKPKVVTPVAAPDDEADDELLDLLDQLTEIELPEEELAPEPMEEEEVQEWVSFAEKMPEFDGGMAAFYKYIGKKMKYPTRARSLGVEGKVFVEFIIDTNGALTEVKVLKGIGAGCDEEALRVIKQSPAWAPGLQRAKPVKVKMVLPITFKLGY